MKLIHVAFWLPAGIIMVAFAAFFTIYPQDVINNSIALHNVTITKYLDTSVKRFPNDNALTADERITILQSQHLINASQLAQVQLSRDAKYYDFNLIFWMAIAGIPLGVGGIVAIAISLINIFDADFRRAQVHS